jgi:transcriptional regulator with XRE-family HTH domain
MLLSMQRTRHPQPVREGRSVKTIRELREERGETQLQLAIALGVTPATVYNWERGQFEPKATQLRALAKHFDASMDDIDFESPMEGKDAA